MRPLLGLIPCTFTLVAFRSIASLFLVRFCTNFYEFNFVLHAERIQTTNGACKRLPISIASSSHNNCRILSREIPQYNRRGAIDAATR